METKTDTFVITDDIRAFQMLTVRSALKLEALGMTSRAGKIRKGWAVRFGLPANTKIPALIEHINKLLHEYDPERAAKVGA